MKTVLSTCFALLFVTNLIAQESQETISIQDIGLEECLIDLKIDSNGLNGSILVSDAKYVVNLNVNDPITNKLLPNVHSKIKSLSGLEHFPNMKRLDCFGNKLTKLDLSKSSSITFLNCSENKIESLNLSNNPSLIDVSCDNNKLNNLILGNNPNLVSLYCSYNNLTTLDVSGCTNLESLDTTGNKIKTIIVNETQLNNIPSGWYKDENTVYKTASNNTQTTPIVENNTSSTEVTKNNTTVATTKKVETPTTPTPASNNQPQESAANYYEKFQSSVIGEYDKLILNPTHLQNKKDEIQKKYNLDPTQLTQWISLYSNFNKAGNNKILGNPKQQATTNYSNFKKSAVAEYEALVLTAAYLQSKKEEIQKKYNLNPKEFTQWISLLGNPSLKAVSVQHEKNTENYYNKFKQSVAKEYEMLVLNNTYIQDIKRQIQQKYKLNAAQLNEWIKKYSKVKTL